MIKCEECGRNFSFESSKAIKAMVVYFNCIKQKEQEYFKNTSVI
jgi:ssDNA-binding Zn-finger/Zn-ribbon topoisomerase 1